MDTSVGAGLRAAGKETPKGKPYCSLNAIHLDEPDISMRSTTSPRLRINSRGAAHDRKRVSAPDSLLADTAEKLRAEESHLTIETPPDTGGTASKEPEAAADGGSFFADTPSTTVSSRGSSPRKRRETHPATSPVRSRFSKSTQGVWEDDNVTPLGTAGIRESSSPRKRRVRHRYMRFQPILLEAPRAKAYTTACDEDSDEEEEEDGQLPMMYRIQSEPVTAWKRGSTLSSARQFAESLQLLEEREDEEDEESRRLQVDHTEEFVDQCQEEDEVRSGKPAAAQRRHKTFYSLGAHVSWTTLLEYAGDSPEMWTARKVHRWLGINEKDAHTFLTELVELRDALNKGESPETQARPEPDTLVTPREPKSDVQARTPSTSSRSFFGWVFGNSQRSVTVQAPNPQDDALRHTQCQQSVGFFSWLFSDGLASSMPNVPKPMRLNHSDSVEYKFDKLDEVGLLGRGAFGQVTLVRCGVTGQLLALKAVSKGMLVEMQLQHSVAIEKAVMQGTSSPFLVKMAATFNRDDKLYLLLEAVMGGDLYTVYRRYNFFGSEEHGRFYAACALCGFEHLHSRRILYRDLKMENLVLDLRGYCKLCDFGTSSFEFDAAYTMCGTPEYMSPEVVCGNAHGPAADWWTLGVLIYEMVVSVTPFAEDEPLQIFEKARAGIEKVDGFMDIRTPWANLVRGLCKQDPNRRLPMLQGGTANVRMQEWFAEVDFDWESLEAGRLSAPHVPPCAGPEDLCNFAGEEQEVPLDLPYFDKGDGWDSAFEDPLGPRNVAGPGM